MNPVGNMGDRNLRQRPTREEVPQNAPADLPVKPADPIDPARSPEGKVGHVERLGCITRFRAPEGQEAGQPDAELLGVSPQVLAHQCR